MRVMKVVNRTFFRVFCMYYPHTVRDCLIICTLCPGPGRLNKISDLFKNVSWNIITNLIYETKLTHLFLMPKMFLKFWDTVR